MDDADRGYTTCADISCGEGPSYFGAFRTCAAMRGSVPYARAR
jgi:hypothetical protein